MLLIEPLGTTFNEMLIGIEAFSFKEINLQMSSGKWWLFVSVSMCQCAMHCVAKSISGKRLVLTIYSIECVHGFIMCCYTVSNTGMWLSNFQWSSPVIIHKLAWLSESWCNGTRLYVMGSNLARIVYLKKPTYMELSDISFGGTRVQWNSMEYSMEFHGTPVLFEMAPS